MGDGGVERGAGQRADVDGRAACFDCDRGGLGDAVAHGYAGVCVVDDGGAYLTEFCVGGGGPESGGWAGLC